VTSVFGSKLLTVKQNLLGNARLNIRTDAAHELDIRYKVNSRGLF